MDSFLLGCAERSKPRSRVRRAEGAGLDREVRSRVTIIVAATYKRFPLGFSFLSMRVVLQPGDSIRHGLRRARHQARKFARQTCMRSIREDRIHDAAMRIGGEAPRWRAHST